MSHVYIEYIAFKNFLSYGNAETEFHFDSKTVNIIVGDSGAGKSSIMDAVCFVLYGKTYKKILKSEIVNETNGRDCHVKIVLKSGGKEYTIERGIKPNVLKVYQDGKELDSKSSASNQQAFIESHILGGMNYAMFMQTSIIGAANFTPFLKTTALERRNVVEGILDLTIFTSALKEAKKRLSDKENEYREVSNELLRLKSVHESESNTISRLSQTVDVSKEQELVDKRRIQIEKEIENLGLELNSLEEKCKSLDVEYRKKKDIGKIDVEPIRAKMQENKTLGSKLADMVNLWDKGQCPTCRATLTKDGVGFDYDGAKKKLVQLRDVVKAQIEEIKSAEQFNREFDQLERDTERAQISVVQKDREFKQKQNELNNVQDVKVQDNSALIEELKSKTISLENDMAKYETKRKKLGKEVSTLIMARDMFKDDGIKAKMIESYLPVINERVTTICRDLNLDIEFEFDETFSETITRGGVNKTSYNAMSEGEKKRLDLAILFAWLHVSTLKSNASSNLLFCDELLDGSLDAHTRDLIPELLRSTSNDMGKSVYVISHNESLKGGAFDSSYHIKKEDGFSYIS